MARPVGPRPISYTLSKYRGHVVAACAEADVISAPDTVDDPLEASIRAEEHRRRWIGGLIPIVGIAAAIVLAVAPPTITGALLGVRFRL